MSTVPAMRERDHQRRAHQEVGADVRVDARFEVAVAGEHRGGDDIVLGTTASSISASSGPELPMQVVQP